jgi:transcriptional regulator with GAF, ATPase, and Fis domain
MDSLAPFNSNSLKEIKLDLHNCKSSSEIVKILEHYIQGLSTHIKECQTWLKINFNECQHCSSKKAVDSDKNNFLHLIADNHQYISVDDSKLGYYFKSSESFCLDYYSFTHHNFKLPLKISQDAGVHYYGLPLEFFNKKLGYLIIVSQELNTENLNELKLILEICTSTLHILSIEQENNRLQQELETENHILKEAIEANQHFGYIVGHSIELEEILEKVEMVAPTDASVLITGESGTGKELIAQAIHERSNRADKPLVKVNCASIPNDLFESEFFGHVKGAFTGAHRNRDGRFQMANGGTLFLDEVGEIPIELQSKLLRVLQEDQFEKIGDDQTQNVDVRIIAATNRDLLNANDHFRKDLYYRLSVFPIHCPSLKQRKGDIVDLVKHYLAQACQQFNKRSIHLEPNQIQDLENYTWPGNIRELKNVVERAVITSKNGKCNFEIPSQSSTELNKIEHILTQDEMQNFEKSNMLKALKKCGGKISGEGGAAELLNMSSSTLASRLGKLGLNKKDF